MPRRPVRIMETIGTAGPLSRQRKTLVIGCIIALGLAALLVFVLIGCGRGAAVSPVFARAGASLLTAADVQALVHTKPPLQHHGTISFGAQPLFPQNAWLLEVETNGYTNLGRNGLASKVGRLIFPLAKCFESGRTQ